MKDHSLYLYISMRRNAVCLSNRLVAPLKSRSCDTNLKGEMCRDTNLKLISVKFQIRCMINIQVSNEENIFICISASHIYSYSRTIPAGYLRLRWQTYKYAQTRSSRSFFLIHFSIAFII